MCRRRNTWKVHRRQGCNPASQRQRADLTAAIWQAQFALMLAVRRDMIRRWQSGRLLTPWSTAPSMICLITQRESELHAAKIELENWLTPALAEKRAATRPPRKPTVLPC
jgi:hypothetical protein